LPRARPERLAAWDATRNGVARVLLELGHRLQAERGQQLSTYFLLEALVAGGGRMRSSQLADALVLARPTVSRMCDRLEHDGLLRRERIEGDGRAVDVVLTKQGRDEYRRCQPAYERLVEELFRG